MALDSTATLKVRKQQSNAFKIPRKHFQPKPTYPAKLSIRYDERIKDILRHTWSQKIYLPCTFPKNPSKCGRESKRRKIWDSETRESAKQETTKTKTVKAFQDGSEAAGPKSSQFTLKITWGLSEESWEKIKTHVRDYLTCLEVPGNLFGDKLENEIEKTKQAKKGRRY